LDLAATPGGQTGDGQADSVILNGTNAADQITLGSSASNVFVTGLAAVVRISAVDAALDQLTINSLGGDDKIDGGFIKTSVIGLTLNGGDGNDALIGTDGNDVIVGGRGSDVAMMRSGDDTFVWNPGDGSDTVEGQGGNDTLQFNGANIAENIDLS